MDLLLQLAAAGRFGRGLPAADQTFIVISDSVMKQLDGLKAVPECRVAVRKFLKEGLESMGPAGEGCTGEGWGMGRGPAWGHADSNGPTRNHLIKGQHEAIEWFRCSSKERLPHASSRLR